MISLTGQTNKLIIFLFPPLSIGNDNKAGNNEVFSMVGKRAAQQLRKSFEARRIEQT